MANPNALIVEVVGDTTKLTKGLADATKQMNKFAGRSKIDAGPAAKDTIDSLHQIGVESEKTAAKEAELITKLEDSQNRMRKLAVGAGIAGLAINRVGANFTELGGNAGKLGNALQSLTSGNIVGFVKGMQSINATDPAKLGADLLKYGDAAKATEFANKAAAAGWDAMSKAARTAALEIANTASSLDAYNLALATTIHDSTSPGAIFNADQHTLRGDSGGLVKGTPIRKGITAVQRNTFFDNAIARELNAAQDQVSSLKKVAAEIQNRIDATKDITRRLNLEDQLLDVQQRIETVQTNAAKEAARLAKERAAAEKARLAALKAAALARQQSRDDLALGLQTTGVSNLRKQLAQLTSRSDINSIPNKLANSLDGARRILNRKWDTISEDSRSNIQNLFDTIRDALNEGATGGPLTKTTQLSENILKGLGLSAADSRTLKARLSSFNSAGTALTGAGSGSGATFVSHTVIDGKVVATTSAKYNRRTRQVNTAQRNGPNAGGYVGA